MKVLVVKAPRFFEASGETQGAPPLLRQFAWLDRLVNGLLGRALHEGVFSASEKHGDFVCLRPVYAPVDMAVLWMGEGAVPWERLRKVLSEGPQLFHWGKYSAAEIHQAEKVFGEVAAWDSSMEPA